MSEWNYKIFWDEVVKQLKDTLPVSKFSLYFPVTNYDSSTENSIIINVPSAFIKKQIIEKHLAEIERRLLEVSGRKLSVEFVIKEVCKTEPDIKSPVVEENIIKEDNSAEHNAAVHNSIELNAEVKKETYVQHKENRGQHPDLNPDYTFDDFVIGPNNSFAANAAIAITRNPGNAYNPVLIYGGVGLGKTHIMQAIGNEIWANTNLKVVYVTAESFTNEFIECLNRQTMPAFKNKYRSADVLLIDDIHFFQGKHETQEEMFHTFNALYEKSKQLVFTCDRPPSEFKNLSKRLQSRFERGLCMDLQTPGYEVRCAILLKKIKKRSLNIDKEIVELVAKNISSNVRDLEAALTKLTAFINITKKELNEQVAIQLLKDFFGSTRQRNVTVDVIQKVVANYFNISIADIKGKKRSKSFTYPRHIAMYLCREMTACSTTELGNEFGGRDHSTIIHGCTKVEDLLKVDPATERQISELDSLIKENINR